MEVERTNTVAIVRRASPEEMTWLTQYLTVDVPEEAQRGRRASSAVMLNVQAEFAVTPTYCAFNPVRRSFPAGLLVNFVPEAAKAGFSVDVNDTRERVCAIELKREYAHWLRDRQWEALSTIVRRGGVGLVKAVTGSGKTEIAIALSRVLACEWLFVVHRTDIAMQSAERYNLRTGETAGTFENGVWKKGSCNFTVATFQAVQSALRRDRQGKAVKLLRGAKDVQGLLYEIEGLFVDEVHSLSGDVNVATLELFERALYRIGASGTPLNRSAKATLQTIGAIGPVLVEIEKDALIAEGVLTPSRIRMIALGQWASREHDWRWVYTNLIVASKERNNLLLRMVEAAAKPCLVFVEELEHVRLLSELLWENGITNDCVDGPVHRSMRARKVQELVQGTVEVLVVTVVFQEGIDIPELRSIVVGGGKQSVVGCLQRLGRGMRTADGKQEFEVWDVLDEGHWWPERHALARKETYEQAGHAVEVLSEVPCG
jgi:superfamily II DNA or RNA helicase